MSFIQSFRAARWLRSTNLVLQALLFVTLFGGLNYLALHSSWRFDLTQLRRHSLSAETRAYLAKLKQPIRVIVTPSKDIPAADSEARAEAHQIDSDIDGLLREYAYALETNTDASLTIEHIDVYQRPRDAEQHRLTPGTVLFISGDRRHPVPHNELYEYKNKQRAAFLGEQKFTAAILDVSNPEKKKIYFLTGHGEMDINSVDPSRGLSEIRNALRERNYAIGTLDLSRTQAIPADAALLVSIGAQNRYEPYEQETLRRYMSTQAGRLAYFATPGVSTTGLEDLLREWGIVSDDVWINDFGPGNRADEYYGDLILSSFERHDVTKILNDNHLLLRFGATRPMRPNPARATDPGLSVTPLVNTAASAWGERNYRRRGTPRYDPGADLAGPLAVATAAERVASKNNLPFSIPVGRVAAFGCSDFVADGRLRAGANNILFFSTLNWLVGRDDQINVPARPIEKFQLALGRDQLTRLRFTLLFATPAAFALIGFIVYWTRRR